MKRFVLLCLLICSVTDWLAAQPCKEVVGYYASWKWYKRDKLVNPVSIDYSKYTIINYAFFKPLDTGDIIEGDPWADKNILFGKVVTRNGSSSHDASTSLIVNARKNNVKVVASIGGWTWSSAFPAIASDEQKRDLFARSCVSLIQKYGFDGIDIDWEFPGGKLHNGSAADRTNFTLLLHAVHDALKAYGGKRGTHFLLTAAFGPAPDHLDQIEWEQVIPLLDIIHVMSYNYNGPWDKITNHNTPLHPGPRDNPDFAISSTIQRLTEVHHVPAAKITMGLAFYGRSVSTNQSAALRSVSNGTPDILTYADEKGTPSYYNIVSKSHLFNRQWDEMAGVPYMTGKAGLNTFVSYDDPESVKLKAAYAIQMQLLGVVIWDLSGDYMETFPGSGKIAGTPLAEALQEAFCENPAVENRLAAACAVDILAYPNPFRDEVDLTWNTDCAILKIIVRNPAGQIVYQTEKLSDGKLKLFTSGWTPGWYVVQLLAASGATGQKVLKM